MDNTRLVRVSVNRTFSVSALQAFQQVDNSTLQVSGSQRVRLRGAEHQAAGHVEEEIVVRILIIVQGA